MANADTNPFNGEGIFQQLCVSTIGEGGHTTLVEQYCSVCPIHGNPAGLGAGLVHVRDCTPEHSALHSLHSLQPPLTGTDTGGGGSISSISPAARATLEESVKCKMCVEYN